MNIFLIRCSTSLICGALLTIGLRKQLTSFDITLPIYAVILSFLIIAAVLFCVSLFIKKNNIGYVAFLTVLGAVPLTMLLSFNFFGDISLRENKRLAKLPTVFITNERFPRQMDTYIDERIGLRSELLAMNLKVGLSLNIDNKPSFDRNGKVIIGKHDWLFFDEIGLNENTKDFQKITRFSQNDLRKIRESFEHVNNTLKELGIPLIVLIAPSKHNIYPEHYSPVYNRLKTSSRYEQIVNEMKQSDVMFVDTLSVLDDAKKNAPIYFKHDTHWTINAGYVVYLELMKHLKKIYNDVFAVDESLIDYVITKHYINYDLLTMSTIYKPKSIEDVYFVTFKDNFTIQTDPKVHAGIGQSLSIKCNETGPKLFFVHDSFGMVITPFLERNASDFIMRWEWGISPLKYINMIKKEKPDVVIWEMHERYINNLITGAYSKFDGQE